jgi:hypothetical protein
MPEAIYKEALDAYVNPFHEFTVELLNAGLINQSYKITNQYSNASFLLQKINTNVFPEPEHLQSNYERLWKYISAECIDFYMPEPKYFPGNETLFCDSNNHYWRVFEFIGDSYTPVKCKASQARDTATVFGEFTACLQDFDAGQLHIVIPGFHDLSLRYRQFEQSLRTGHTQRLTVDRGIKKQGALRQFL